MPDTHHTETPQAVPEEVQETKRVDPKPMRRAAAAEAAYILEAVRR
jgi:hypothetical protein